MLLIPLFASLLLLNPLTNWLAFGVYGHSIGFVEWASGGWRTATGLLPDLLSWHLHLWFLFSLFIFALLTPGLNRMYRLAPVAWIVGRMQARPALAPFLLACAVGVATVLLRIIHYRWIALPPGSHPFQYIIMASFTYLPFFAVGVLAFIERPVFDYLHRLPLFGLLLFGVANASWPLAESHLPWAAWQTGYLFFRAAFIMVIVMAILHVAQRYFSRSSRILSTMTDSVYSFYLFHLLFVYIAATLLMKITSNSYIIFAIILATGYPLLIALHVKGIARSPFLLWLLNGKPWPWPAKARAVESKA